MNKLTSAFLITLVFSMIVSSIPNIVHADSQTESLIKIATKARDQIKIQLSKIDNISEELKTKFEEGSDRIKLLREAAAEDNISEARKQFLEAMRIFNEISKRISEQTSEAALTSKTSQTSTFSNQLDRWVLYVERLKQIASRNDINIGFTDVEQLIETAKKYIHENNYDQASASNFSATCICKSNCSI